jgi:hypothetical protein
MNGKYSAKVRVSLAVALAPMGLALVGLALTGWLIPLSVTADFDNLGQQLRVQQQKSRFRLKLEQVQESARQRAATVGTASTASIERAGPSTPVGLGGWTTSPRLHLSTVTEPVQRDTDPKSARRLRARQAYERDQRRILDHRQQRHALIAGSRTRGPAVLDSYAEKRRNLVRYRSQNQRLSLRRKLRR